MESDRKTSYTNQQIQHVMSIYDSLFRDGISNKKAVPILVKAGLFTKCDACGKDLSNYEKGTLNAPSLEHVLPRVLGGVYGTITHRSCNSAATYHGRFFSAFYLRNENLSPEEQVWVTYFVHEVISEVGRKRPHGLVIRKVCFDKKQEKLSACLKNSNAAMQRVVGLLSLKGYINIQDGNVILTDSFKNDLVSIQRFSLQEIRDKIFSLEDLPAEYIGV